MSERPRESWATASVKALLYSASIVLYLLPLASGAGVASALSGAVAGMGLAVLAERRRLRLMPALLALAAGLTLALLLGGQLLDSQRVGRLLGIRWSILVADVLLFGLGALTLVFALRFLSQRRASLAVLEVLFVAGAAVTTFSDHRHRMLNRPRFFSDWAWSLGVDPGTVLLAVGVAASLAAILLFLRGQRLMKLAVSLGLLLFLGMTLFWLQDKRVESEQPLDALGLSGRSSKGRGSGGGGPSENPFKDNYSAPQEPSPVAIAILRDDFQPPGEILYFRQTALSHYNGHHLVVDGSRRRDDDLLLDFPRGGALRAPSGPGGAEHLMVPTTMYLLVDHPQPVALSHAVGLSPAYNPNPQQFVAAYDVRSLVLAVPPSRLLGRRSIPQDWSGERRAHYLAVPDDPRYSALSDIVVRQVDPRFAGDDLARAYAIKRYLEREGFYTMRGTHASATDPTASFLFGSLRGYCVHFAHAAVYLFRSQGIASRVALGYAVQTTKRGGGSSVLIMSDRAHAWPEIYLEGVGWVTLDIHPERTDVAPPTPVDYDLEKLLGELARNDQTAGLRPDGRPLRIPWAAVGLVLASLIGLVLAAGWLGKGWRALAPRLVGPRRYPRAAYLAVLDRLSDLGYSRQRGETRERHAERCAGLSPHFAALTRAHLGFALGSARELGREELAALVQAVRADLRKNVSVPRRLVGSLRPLTWMRTR